MQDLSTKPAPSRMAHEFANDIIQKFGGTGSLLGQPDLLRFERGPRRAVDEIWAMDWDGGNQKQLTRLRSTFDAARRFAGRQPRSRSPADAKGTPRIMMLDTLAGRPLPFYNQEASLNATPSFTPDGKQIYYASTAAGLAQIYVAGLDGQGFRRVSHRDAIEVEPKVNPKNSEPAAVGGRTGASADLPDERGRRRACRW